MTLGLAPVASQPSDSTVHLTKSLSTGSKQSLPSIRSIRSRFQGSFRNRTSRTSKQHSLVSPSTPALVENNDPILDIHNHSRSLSQGLLPVSSLVDLSQPSHASLTPSDTTVGQMVTRQSLQPARVPQRSGSLSSLRSSVRKRSESFKALSLNAKQGKSRSVPPTSEIPQGRVSQVVTSLEHSANSPGRIASLSVPYSQSHSHQINDQPFSFPRSDFMPNQHFSSPAMSDGSMSSVSLRNRCNSTGYHRSISQDAGHLAIPPGHQEKAQESASISSSSPYLDSTGDCELEPILENAESELAHLNTSKDNSFSINSIKDDISLQTIDNDVERKFISDMMANAYLGSTRQRSPREASTFGTLSPQDALPGLSPTPNSTSSSVRNSIEKSMHRYETLCNLEHTVNQGKKPNGCIMYEGSSSVDSFNDDQIISPLDIIIREFGGSTTPQDPPISPITPINSMDGQQYFGKADDGPKIKITGDAEGGVVDIASLHTGDDVEPIKVNGVYEHLEYDKPDKLANGDQAKPEPEPEPNGIVNDLKVTESFTSPETSQISLPPDTMSRPEDSEKAYCSSSQPSVVSLDHISSTSPTFKELSLVTPGKQKSWSLCELEESYARMKKLLDSNSKLADSAKSIYSSRLSSPLRDIELNPSVASLIDPISSRDSLHRSRHTSPSPLMQTSEPLPLIDDDWDELPFPEEEDVSSGTVHTFPNDSLESQDIQNETQLNTSENSLQAPGNSDDTSSDGQDMHHNRDSIISDDNSDTIQQDSTKLDRNSSLVSPQSPASLSNTMSLLGGLKSQAGKELQAMILERSSKESSSNPPPESRQNKESPQKGYAQKGNRHTTNFDDLDDEKGAFNNRQFYKIPKAWFENTPNKDNHHVYGSRIDGSSMPQQRMSKHRRENSEPPVLHTAQLHNYQQQRQNQSPHIPLDTIKKYDKIELFLKLIETESELESTKWQATSERNLLMDALRDSQQLVRELRRENSMLRAQKPQKQEYISSSTSPSRSQLRWASRSSSPNLSLSGSNKPNSLSSIRSNSDMFSPKEMGRDVNKDMGRLRMEVRSMTPTVDDNYRSSSSLSLRHHNNSTSTLPTPPPSATSDLPKYQRHSARHRTAPPISGNISSPNSRLKPPPLGYNYSTGKNHRDMRDVSQDFYQRTPSLESTFASKLAGFHDTPLLQTRIPSSIRWGSTVSTPTSLGRQDSRGSIIHSVRPRSLGPNGDIDDDVEEEDDQVPIQDKHYTSMPANYDNNYHPSRKSYSPLRVPSSRMASHSRSLSASSNVSSTFGDEHNLPPLQDSWHLRRHSVASIENISLAFNEHDRRFLDDLENDFVPPDGFDEQTGHILPMLTTYN